MSASIDQGGGEEIVRKTTLILLAVAINALEFFIPRIPFFPWLKPGLANCVTILWIVEFGVVDALLFTLLRIWIAGFYFGFSFYTISLSLSGGICSTAAMGLAWIVAGKRGWLGTVGIGVTGALIHNLTQLVVIYFLLAKNVHLFYQLPLMLVASIVFGSVTGVLAPALLSVLRDAPLKLSRGKALEVVLPMHKLKRDSVVAVLLLFAGCIVALIDNMAVCALCAGASTLFTQLIRRGSLRLLLSPIVKFWPLFLFIACVHCFLSYGTKVEAFPFLTYEGVRLTAVQWLKLWTWLELSLILAHFNFHYVMLRLLKGLFPQNRAALFAGVLSLEYFPAIISAVQQKAKSRFAEMARHPLIGVRRGFWFVSREIERLAFAERGQAGQTNDSALFCGRVVS